MRQPGNAKVTVCVSDLLRKRHRKFVQGLESILGQHNVSLCEISGTADIWARDYLPIQRHDGVFVSYTYRPDYLRGYSHLATDWRKVRGLPETRAIVDCDLVLDGGNIVLQGRTAIVTSKIFAENADLSHRQVEGRLREAFELEMLVVIPPEPGDVMGHADGMLAWSGPREVILNDYRKIMPSLHADIAARLERVGVDSAVVPYAPARSRRGVPPATGVYTNVLILPELVIAPTYGLKSDDVARRQLEARCCGVRIVTLDCSCIAKQGGSIHCVTAEQYYAYRG